VTDQSIWQQIAAPLHPRQIKTRKHDGARYISRIDVINRLNATCPDQWHFETEVISVNPWVVKGRLTVAGVVREDLGMSPNEKTPQAAKAAASDALKRCASQFGFALELFGDDYEDTSPALQSTNGTHWIDDPFTRKKFWAYAKETAGLTETEVYEALEVDSIHKFAGTKEEARQLIDEYADFKRGSE
jgi:hypothetical protein